MKLENYQTELMKFFDNLNYCSGYSCFNDIKLVVKLKLLLKEMIDCYQTMLDKTNPAPIRI